MAVRVDYSYKRMDIGKSRSWPRTGLWISLFTLVCLSLAGYLYFGQAIGSQPPAYCNLPNFPYGDSGTDPEPQTCSPTQEISDLTDQGETILSLLNANISDEPEVPLIASRLASAVRSSNGIAFDVNTALKAGRRYNVFLDAGGRFLKFTLELDPANVFNVARQDDRIVAWKDDVVLDFKKETLTFTMKGTLNESILAAGENSKLASELTNVFRWDIDFKTESMRGDSCKVLFERKYADDKPSGYGRILCAIYDGKKTGTKIAVLFRDEYLDEKGTELKKDFLRSPLNEIRVTSGYGPRFHPIFRYWRKHNGVDYGAASGTPVWSIANGVVTFSGWSGGYGNYVCIKHDNGYESRYGHLQKFFVHVGQRVKQRDRIGLVGQTGDATGPHLDFQLLVAGQHVNPQGEAMKKKFKSLKPLEQPLVPRYTHLVNNYLTSLGHNRRAENMPAVKTSTKN